jgi:hypothetical protein
MHSDDPDPCPASLVMSPGRRCFGQSRRRSQKSNCRSPCKVSNGKGFGGTCPLALCARRVTTRWEYSHLRLGCDSENGSVLVYQVPGVLLYLTSRRGKLTEKGRMRHARRRADEGQGSRMQLTKKQATKRFNPELKLPRLMSAKN